MTSARNVWELSRHFLADQEGVIVVFKVYMDETGIHDGSPVVAVSAYLARPKTWRAWTKDWNRAKRPIKVFHSSDCANLHGEFEGWDKPRRDAFVANLLPVIPAHAIAGMAIGIAMDDFREAMDCRPDLQHMFGNPYTACFQWALTTIMRLADEHGSGERTAFVHETNDFKQDAWAAFDWVQKHENPHGRIISLAFGSKADYPPLQAADVLAYEGGKFLLRPDKPKRRSFIALDPDEKRIFIRRYAKDNMHILISTLEKIAATHGASGVLP